MFWGRGTLGVVSVWKPVEATLRLLLHLACHWTIAAIVLLAVWGFEHLVTALWNVEEPKFFNYIPVKYIFHAMDLGVLIVVGVLGVVTIAIAIYRGMRE